MNELARVRPAGPRKLLYLAATVTLCALLLEGGARVLEAVQRRATEPNLYGDNPFVTQKNRVPVFEVEEIDGRAMYRRTAYLQEWIYKDLRFPVRKPAHGFRVFCLGGSASMGWPYKNPESYPGLLEAKLRQVLPDHDVQVINLSGFSFASYRVKAVFDEVIDYDPDLILVYSGNNEFLENFVYSARRPSDELPGALRGLALARLVYDAAAPRGPSAVEVDIKNYAEQDFISNRLSFAFGKASRLRESPEQLRQVIDHYRFNISSLSAECVRRRVPVMLMTVPVNRKDWKPNVSVHGTDLSAADLARWQEAFRDGFLALERGDAAAAIPALERARDLDDAHAEGHFLLARAYHRAGRIQDASDEYTAALAHDAYPFRALPEFQEVLHDTARTHGVPLVDLVRTIDDLSGDGIPGLDTLLDYVHLTAQSNEAVAHAVLTAMRDAGYLPAAPAVPLDQTRTTIPPEVDEQWWTLARLHSQFLIMRQYDGLQDLGDRLARAVDLEVRRNPGGAAEARSMLARVRDVQRVVEPYQRLLRAEKLGLRDQEFPPDVARKIFDDYIQMIRRYEAGQLSDQEFEQYVPEGASAGGPTAGPTTRRVEGETVTVEWDGNVQILRRMDGSLHSRGTLIEGKREGVHEFFHPDGTRKIESTWVANRPEGLWRYFYDDGSPEAEGHYEHGRRVGVWQTWHRNGTLESRGEYVEGQRAGPWSFQHADGSPDPVRSGRYDKDVKVSD